MISSYSYDSRWLSELQIPSSKKKEHTFFSSRTLAVWHNFCLQPTELCHIATTDCQENEDMWPSFWVMQLKIRGSVTMENGEINVCRYFGSSSLGSRLWDQAYSQGRLLESVLRVNTHGKLRKGVVVGRGRSTALQAQQRPKPVPLRIIPSRSVEVEPSYFQLWWLAVGCCSKEIWHCARPYSSAEIIPKESW